MVYSTKHTMHRLQSQEDWENRPTELVMLPACTEWRHCGFYMCALTPEQHARTCDYWYLIQTFGCTAHTAFRTRPALFRWLQDRGLTLPEPLPDSEGTHQLQRIRGAYIERMHAKAATMPENGAVALKLFNARYREARITVEQGVYVVNFLNPNAEGMREVHWSVGRAWEDLGRSGMPDLDWHP